MTECERQKSTPGVPFLNKLPNDYKIAVDIRNKDWLEVRIADLLREHHGHPRDARRKVSAATSYDDPGTTLAPGFFTHLLKR